MQIIVNFHKIFGRVILDKNGFMPSKLISIIGEDRKSIIDEIKSKIES